MGTVKKPGYFGKHAKSSAAFISLMIHVVLVILSLTFVAVRVIVKDDQVFEAKQVNRPRMKLKKLVVPIDIKKKKVNRPKLRKNIVVEKKIKSVDIVLPELTGIKGGLGSLTGDGGLGIGFTLGDIDLFGATRGTGNELMGKFFDLKTDPDGGKTSIGNRAAKNSFDRGTQLAACGVIKEFVSEGCSTKRFAKKYFMAPQMKYTTTLMMPPMSATEAPRAFGVENQVKPSYWICHYSGQIAAPESGRYRFCGIGDDILIVRINRRTVMDGSWPELIRKSTLWTTRDENNRKFVLNGNKYGSFQPGIWEEAHKQIADARGFEGKATSWSAALGAVRVNDAKLPGGSYMKAASRMVIGDWVPLKKGQLVDIDIIIGEIPGGDFFCRLLIEQEGKTYKMVQSDAGLRPVLPVFKTLPVDNEDIISQMKLDPNEMTLEGPSFGAKANSSKNLITPTF